MKKIVVLSDTHGNIGAIRKIENIIRESDMVIHLGDGYNDLNYLYPEIKGKLYRVHGNCDYGFDKEMIVETEGVKIFATHGDLYGVGRGADRLVAAAKENGCIVALYGHTHVATIEEKDGITVINPGTLERYGVKNSFCYLVVNGEKITAVINENAN